MIAQLGRMIDAIEGYSDQTPTMTTTTNTRGESVVIETEPTIPIVSPTPDQDHPDQDQRELVSPDSVDRHSTGTHD